MTEHTQVGGQQSLPLPPSGHDDRDPSMESRVAAAGATGAQDAPTGEPTLPPPGWYPVPGSRPVQRFWTGTKWEGPEYPYHVSAAQTPTNAAYLPPSAAPTNLASAEHPVSVVNTDRGPRISETKKKTNHVFHLLMSVFTLGLWLPVWFIVWLVNQSKTEQVKYW